MAELEQASIRLIEALTDGKLRAISFGTEAITHLNEIGILVDLSHCGRRTSANDIKTSTRPVAFTHTGCAARSDHPRNLSDAELAAVADKGGVSGIYITSYLNDGHQPTAGNGHRSPGTCHQIGR